MKWAPRDTATPVCHFGGNRAVRLFLQKLPSSRNSIVRLRWMDRSNLRTALLAIAILPVIAAGACRSSDSKTASIVVYGFSALENVLKDEIIPAFEEDWLEKTGQKVQIVTSFAGSGTITNQIIFGAPAQVALVATEVDATNIRETRGDMTSSQDFGNGASFAYSVAGIVTREGNPKGLGPPRCPWGPGATAARGLPGSPDMALRRARRSAPGDRWTRWSHRCRRERTRRAGEARTR